jgi:hypothetical protein
LRLPTKCHADHRWIEGKRSERANGGAVWNIVPRCSHDRYRSANARHENFRASIGTDRSFSPGLDDSAAFLHFQWRSRAKFLYPHWVKSSSSERKGAAQCTSMTLGSWPCLAYRFLKVLELCCTHPGRYLMRRKQIDADGFFLCERKQFLYALLAANAGLLVAAER